MAAREQRHIAANPPWRAALPLVAVGLVAVGCSGQPSNDLEGTWELVSYEYAAPDTVMRGDTADMRSQKVLNGTHFSWVTVSPDQRAFIGAATGTYSIRGDTYTEVTEHASQADHVDRTYSFTYRIAGGLWLHTGIVNGVRIQETWRRVP